MIKSNLRRICFDRDIRSIAELQRLTNISRPTLYKLYENKDVNTIKLDTICTICNALDIQLSDLIGFNKE
jgi:putative transcriptional regulator